MSTYIHKQWTEDRDNAKLFINCYLRSIYMLMLVYDVSGYSDNVGPTGSHVETFLKKYISYEPLTQRQTMISLNSHNTSLNFKSSTTVFKLQVSCHNGYQSCAVAPGLHEHNFSWSHHPAWVMLRNKQTAWQRLRCFHAFHSHSNTNGSFKLNQVKYLLNWFNRVQGTKRLKCL